ncbi:MAG: two-component regulator propeller domain-containing protein [Bacteroidota bacterium]
MKRFTALLTIALLSYIGSAQTYQFFTYGLPEGMCDNFAYTINQDPMGFLWIGTSQGLCRFDGRVFEQDFKGDSIPQSIAHTSLMDSRDRLWFGHENGLLSVLEDGRFTRIDPGVEGDNLRSKISAIREDASGNILVLCQQTGLLVISPNLQIIHAGDPADPADPFAGKVLYDFQQTSQGHLLVGTNMGMLIYRYDSSLETYIQTGAIADLEYMGIMEIVPGINENEYWVGTEDEGLFRLEGTGYDPDAYVVEKLVEDSGLAYASVSSIRFDGSRRVWVNDFGKGIYRIELDENGIPGSFIFLNVDTGIPHQYISHIFIDKEGNQWFSSQGSGIAVLRDQAFTFFNPWQEEPFADVNSICYRGDEYWFGGRGRLGYSSEKASEEISYLGFENGVPDDRITALYMDQERNLYMGTSRSGLFVKREGSNTVNSLVVSRNSLENIVNAIDGNGDSIFVATNNGVYTLNLKTGNRTSRSTANGLPHNKINDVFVDHDGVAWVATATSGLVSVNSEKQFLIEGKPKLEFKTLEEGTNGVIWAGTDGDGVIRFDFNEGSLDVYNAAAGLKNDYTYAMGIDPKGYVWIGHRNGLSRIDPGLGTIATYGKESGFTSDIRENAALSSGDGKLFFGTNEGVIQYDAYQAREDTLAPRLSLKSVHISDVPYDPEQEIKLKYGRYRLRIDFVGINLSNPDQVTYRYKLDGYEDEWREISGGGETYAYYSRVEDGDYSFLLKACDGNGNCSTEAVSVHITVKIPIWKAWWFILSAVILVLATIFVIFKIRERNQKAIQEYLQRQLDERTREVVQQKEEIEIKNRDITDSINYAQRIQASILPPIKKLHDAFTGSFVFYQPRDIVSGDFYWYEKIDEHKFMVVCADSTGHGVPGAFMSMIGTTLIKDICLRSGIQRPSEVLTTLDNEVREALNQNMETSGSNDGMDIIVAQVDMRNYKFIVSSAMRPVIIYSGGEQIYVKGSRSSIGGQLDDNRVEKDFIDQEFDLNKGDIIYMFSDGYPDQFGGPLGRKFKMVRLKNLLRDIHDKPMDEQYNYVKSNFFLWKEDLEQVDDVLFMGIKL